MSRHLSVRSLSAAVCILTLAFAANVGAITVIVPNNLPNPNGQGTLPASQTYGDQENLFPFFPGAGTPLRYQQVYDASQFSAFAPGGEDMTQINFREGATTEGRLDHGVFATTIPLIEFTLSTTSATPNNLSSTFANNLGPDATTVYGTPGVGSPLAISSEGDVAGDPAAFDISVTLTTPFHYDPSKGNLLLDIQNYEGAESPNNIEFDATMESDSVSRSYNFGSATATTANYADPLGVVTEFVAVPEPGSLFLLAMAFPFAIAVAARRRWAHSKLPLNEQREAGRG